MKHQPGQADEECDNRDQRYENFVHLFPLGLQRGLHGFQFGVDVTSVRIGLVAAIVLGAGALLPVYFIAGWIAEDQPREVAAETKDERKFWQGVRASPSQSARDIRGRLREIDRRLADIEQYVTTENRSLAREIEQLR